MTKLLKRLRRKRPREEFQHWTSEAHEHAIAGMTGRVYALGQQSDALTAWCPTCGIAVLVVQNRFCCNCGGEV